MADIASVTDMSASIEWVVSSKAGRWSVEFNSNLGHARIAPNEKGKGTAAFSYSGVRLPVNFHQTLKEIVFPEARLMMPPPRGLPGDRFRGRYGDRLSEHRRLLCEAIALVLNRRGLIPAEETQ